MGKNSLNNFIFHLSWLNKLSPDSYTSPQNQLWIFKTLWVIIFWVRITNKMLNVTWYKNSFNNYYLSLVMALWNFAPAHTHPLKTICEFSRPYTSYYISELELLIKCWIWIGIKIHSIILSFTCHGLINFPPLIHIPLYSFVNFQNPMSYYFLS